jgi:hypothetical protein
VAGHGHVTPNADGTKARCGGPMLCKECAVEYVQKHNGLGLVHSEEFVQMFLGFAFAEGLYRSDITPGRVLEAWDKFKGVMGKTGTREQN